MPSYRTLAPLALPLLLLSAPSAQPAGFRLEVLTSGLSLGVSMAFAPDGRLFIAERITGNIRILKDGQLQPTPWAVIQRTGTSTSEQGLLGIAVDPNFTTNGYVYVYYTRTVGSTHNVIARLQEVNGQGTNLTVISPQIFSTSIHNGGPLAIGQDGKLLLAGGDGASSSTAQSLGSLNGKILRVNTDGSVPADNPYVNTPGAQPLVWSYGHRNQFGLCIHPVTGLPYTTENGQNTRDEVNRILRGANYGWPIHEGTETVPDPNTEDPLLVFAPTPDPTGCCFYTGALYPSQYVGGWFISKYSFNQLSLLTLNATGDRVVSDTLFHTFPGRNYGVVDGPDGNLYVLYSNTANRGAENVGRFVWDAAPNPSINVAAVANQSVGGSLTVGLRGTTGEVGVIWAGGTKYTTPISTPYGDLWVPFDVVAPGITIPADNRLYVPIAVPNDPALRGQTVHFQGVASINGRTDLRTTNPHQFTLR